MTDTLLTPAHRGMRFLSPLRYPGGKSWLAPTIAAWLHQNGTATLVEPFAGGASVSLEVADSGLGRARMAELDPVVAAFWQCVLTGDLPTLLERVRAFVPTPAGVCEATAAAGAAGASEVDVAFATLVLNRTRHGGVIASRAGSLGRGERGRGLASRWYPDTLITRLQHARTLAPNVRLHHGDWSEVVGAREVAYFVDPPYSLGAGSPGRRLYTHHDVDHEQLFAALAATGAPVALTYHDHESVRALAHGHGMQVAAVAARGNRGVRRELLISNDLPALLGAARVAA